MSRHRQQSAASAESLTIDEIAKLLNVSRPVVYRLRRDDPDFEMYRVGQRLRMRRGVLERWIRQQEEKEKVA